LVGESGSGKSMTALTVMQLLPHLARAEGRVTFDGIDILRATEDQMCALRGDDIGMVFQEPTTALDVVLQAQILDLLRDLVRENRMGLLLISHDLAVVTEMADRLTILRHGEVTEAGDTARTLSEQQHPYTRELAHAW
ncbi:MAG: ATP-binding cassette domain-containing protein, partial [Mesorhizobium sp.]